MLFTINGKEQELKFNIGFIRALNKVYTADMNGISFGMGLNMANVQLQQYDPSGLTEVIRAALKGKFKLETIDEAVELYAEENDGLGGLFEAIIEEMGKSVVVKDTMKRTEKLGSQ